MKILLYHRHVLQYDIAGFFFFIVTHPSIKVEKNAKNVSPPLYKCPQNPYQKLLIGSPFKIKSFSKLLPGRSCAYHCPHSFALPNSVYCVYISWGWSSSLAVFSIVHDSCVFFSFVVHCNVFREKYLVWKKIIVFLAISFLLRVYRSLYVCVGFFLYVCVDKLVESIYCI